MCTNQSFHNSNTIIVQLLLLFLFKVLILQLEGMKHWRLYPPLTHLPESCSKDLNIEDIGTPSHDFILEVH